MRSSHYHAYINLLHAELIPALGCTEPIAIAYAAATAAKILGSVPKRIQVKCSGNIIKNVKSVIVPNSGGMKGIEASAVLGAIAGDASQKLEVLVGINEQQINQCKQLIREGICQVALLDSPITLHIIVTVQNDEHNVMVEIKESHLNICTIQKDQVTLFSNEQDQASPCAQTAQQHINIDEIIEFARNCDIQDIQTVLDKQISCNSKIAEEGLKNNYGACVGKTLLELEGDTIKTRAKAFAAAGSDARMSGCDLPVVINSGSGNQGLTVSMPVIEYAKELKVDQDTLYRALVLSNLIALYQKKHIGKLSAYCGVVCAATGSGAAITFLKGGTDQQIKDTIVNTLGTTSGIICDGAKPSCAAKIATSVDAAILSHEMAMRHRVLLAGDGIVKQDADDTINAVGRLACKGMLKTDQEILQIMLDKDSD